MRVLNVTSEHNSASEHNRALEHRDEKSVTTLKRADMAAHAQGEFGVARGEFGHLIVIFDFEKRTGGIGQMAAGTHTRRDLVQNIRLNLHQMRQPVFCQRPFALWAA